MSQHILIIDDDIEITELLSTFLSSEGYTISVCNDGVRGLAAAKEGNADLILLDVMMPGLNGFEVLQALGGSYSIPILMLTAKGDAADKVLGLELGADDYLAKPFQSSELLARIKAILRRIDITKNSQTNLNETSINQVVMKPATREVFCNEKPVELTGTEYEILAYFLERTGTIVSKDEISQQVLGRKITPFDRSIDMHVSNIRRKLHETSDSDKFKTVRGAGYIFLSGENG
ncbi:response regulator transcription factor [Thalassotalea agarivorans]|uniref:Two-component system, OmpR family, response regulator CpxR n=1 Tax=Thalassotalea agarivorans TaxID=349064 RepID=A0A1I0HS46_THASX|nr:response regulator transcription factor [Thalassotalea agarivorans]SET86003.1 two-component system, OmpR family, response regulator CpxR [Thalassotalea agarivorans]